MASNILVVGGSRHIGYHASLRFLKAGSKVTFLLRSPAYFDDDKEIQKYVQSKKAQLVKGDALIVDDVRKAWAKASEEGPVDLLLFTVGFTGDPKFHLTKGFTMNPKNLVTQCLLNMLCEMPKTGPLPKVVALSTAGVTRTSREKNSLLLRPMYGYLISEPIKDKLGMERVLFHSAGWAWNPHDGEPSTQITGERWTEREGLPAPGTLKDTMIVRAALLNDGECRADLKKDGPAYRADEGDIAGFSISREDVAHFIFEAVTKDWVKYGKKQVSVTY
ncbi:hypothetical protein BDN70DRAFT_812147 [Pholiota conissans]|uniref:NAD(P)-binding domain-containing protein n=1 Tax=Pholiota conissans TaxID=109636 RepID=A0A9P5YKD1_9AGAR|nr:hypothetical protein BDN70DRAFT_869207 [Pholiota conissans]KAF9476511.1 hypothetical protein BDN70DRAFT_812147 [Pholiota conissans]